MKLNKYKLKDLITSVSEKNKQGLYSEVLGVAIEKEFMPSVANLNGTDLTKYSVVRKNRFAFNPMHVGRDKKLPIAMYRKDIPALVSPAYEMFEVNDKQVNLEYLMLYFKNPSFDHLCWFYTDGSVRGGLSWSDFCDIEIELPSIEEQEKVVRQYKTIENRIEKLRNIVKVLLDTSNRIFMKYYGDILDTNRSVDNNCLLCELQTIADITNGYAFDTEDMESSYSGNEYFAIFKQANISVSGFVDHSATKSWIKKNKCESLKRFLLKKNDVLMAMTDMKENLNILGHTVRMDINDDYIVNQRVGVLRSNGFKNTSPEFLFLLTNNTAFLKRLRIEAHYGVQVNLSTADIKNIKIIVKNEQINERFNKEVKPLFKLIDNYNSEILLLKKINRTLTAFI